MKNKLINLVLGVTDGALTILIFLLSPIPIVVLFLTILIVVKVNFLFPFRYKVFNFIVSIAIFLVGAIVIRHGKINRGLTIVVSNHTSLLDYMLIGKTMGTKPWNVVAGKNLWENKKTIAEKFTAWTIGYLVKKFSISIDRKDENSRVNTSRKILKELLVEKRNVAIFPEGGRTPKGVIEDKKIILEKFDDGIFKIALKCKIPIQPVVFVWPAIWRGKDDDRFGIHPCIVHIHYLKILNSENYQNVEDFVSDCHLQIIGVLERSKKVKRFLKSSKN
jgi:1-acyl-sn-glycerol-3-phosphate acyltransferase